MSLALSGDRGKVESSAIDIAKHTLLSGGLILAVGTITGFVARKIRVPDIALFLIVGMAIGPAVLGLIDIKADYALYQIILVFGASYILFDGGASLRFEVLKRVWITIVVLATLGVLVTAAITAFAAHGVLGVSWIVALLLGATIASTDPATLVPIFRQIKIRDRVAQTVMAESAFNDATGAILTFAVLSGHGRRRAFDCGVSVRSAQASGDRDHCRRRAWISGRTSHCPRPLGLSRGVCAGRDAHGRDRRIFRGRWLAIERLHGRFCVRHHDWKQGCIRIQDAAG
jgi:hypothetical protein